jgi:CRP-like cAMP-binding protein
MNARALGPKFCFLYVCSLLTCLMLQLLREYVSGYVEMTDEDFSLLAEKIVMRTFGRRELLMRPGETEQYMNFIVKGLVCMYFYKGKEEVIINIAREGELVSSSASYLSGQPSNYYVETLEATTVFSLGRDQLDKLYGQSSRIERLGRLLITRFVLQKEEWEQEWMRLDTRERFLRFVAANPELVKRVPQKYLASYLNMKPETFSRQKRLLTGGRSPVAKLIKP